MRNLLLAVDHMHEEGYIHRDLKPEQIVKVGDEYKLIDFGTVRHLKTEQTKLRWGQIDRIDLSDYVSTRWYRAPECLLSLTDYDEKVDVFAMGCIMAEMFSKKPLFCGKNTSD